MAKPGLRSFLRLNLPFESKLGHRTTYLLVHLLGTGAKLLDGGQGLGSSSGGSWGGGSDGRGGLDGGSSARTADEGLETAEGGHGVGFPTG